jgi:dodecin
MWLSAHKKSRRTGSPGDAAELSRSRGRPGSREPADRTPNISALTRAARVVDFSRHNREGQMATNQTYVKTEVVGSSDKSVSDAIESAIAVASRSLRNLAWFEVIDVRGSIHNNKVANYQVTLKLGLKYEPKA